MPVISRLALPFKLLATGFDPSLLLNDGSFNKVRNMALSYLKANWSEAIEMGLPSIDRQHKQLFDLAASFRGEGDQIRVMKSLAMLSAYANTHLEEEEAMLQGIAYPKLAEHKLHHLRFRHMLRELLDDSRRMTLDQIADRIEALINGWFYQHILTVDAEYAPSVKANMNVLPIVDERPMLVEYRKV